MKANRAELAILRGKRNPEALSLWVAAFGKGNEKRARRYALAVATFLGQPPLEGGTEGGWEDYLGQYSPNTRKAYAYAVTEFFEWLAAHHNRIVPPEEVTRLDTENYVNWLANRPFSLASEKLKDGDKETSLELYQIVDQSGSASLQDIINQLSPKLHKKYFGTKEENVNNQLNRRRLSYDVRKLVTMDVLEGMPTLATLRQQFPQAGISRWTVPLGEDEEEIPLEDVFIYKVREVEGADRTTIAQRVSALSSFWKVLMQGENVTGGEALLQYNIWEVVKKRVNRGLSSLQKEASRQQKMPSDKVIQMLRNAPNNSLVQMRNKAILYLMVFAGVRTTELLMLRRAKPEKGNWKAWFDDSEPPAIQVLRKGNKWQRLPYPPAALKPLIEFQRELEKHAAPSYAQYTDPQGDHFIDRDDSAWYFRDLQLPDAPLFPPLSLWGNNSVTDYRKPMSRIQCFRLLRRVAEDSGLSAEDIDLVHPHAIRHFAANAMVSGGKDLREVQAILGHSSVLTTEGYLQDIEGDVKLSGQEAILSYLESRGQSMAPPTEGPIPVESSRGADRPVVETTAFEISDQVPEVAPEEVEILTQLSEPVPTHELPVAPPEYNPEVVAMAMPGDIPPVLETDSGLIGVDGSESTEILLEDLAQTVRDGQSPGSPAWVYEAMADPTATHETVIFNRRGERDLDWLKEHYPKVPKDFGVGHESYLPWYVKAAGRPSRGGFFKGIPPFPVFSPDQANPETTLGEQFLDRVEQTYSRFVHGDVEKGLAPSPLRSIGMVRWFSFFVFHSKKLEESLSKEFSTTTPTWKPWNSVVSLRDFRAHDDAWLVQWLADNAHTYRASIDVMKRGVPRTVDDMTAGFLKSAFEGVELITDVPEWMIENDPVRALYESDPRQWKEMISWLKNVTGQVLEPSRKLDREDQEKFATEEQKTKARMVRDVLVSTVHLVDRLSFAKHRAKEQVKELRDQLRTQLYWYATAASGVQRLKKSLDVLKLMSTREFNKAMAEEYERLGIPDPNAEPYRSLKGKKRVAAIVATLFPDLPELSDTNVFADSKLFDPKWFRIDEKNKTVCIEKPERNRLQRQFGQDPELLVRRAVRAMWESRTQDYEKLWGIMMSYFSWIVPSGKEMESQVLGIPVADLGDEELNRQARKNWLKAWSVQMKNLAMGKDLDESLPEKEEKLEPWQQFLQEESGKTGKDALDYMATDAVDFAMSVSISGGYADSPEDLLLEYEEATDYYQNRSKRALMPNGKSSYVLLEGEKPQRWYQVDLFGRRQGHLRPNAPPVLMSPGAVYRAQKRVFPARQLLPSPFRMISAMDLPDD